MSYAAQDEVLQGGWDLTGGEFAVLLVLAHFANNEREAWPSQATLAERACISESSVTRHLSRLVRKGFIQRTGSRRNQAYELLPLSTWQRKRVAQNDGDELLTLEVELLTLQSELLTVTDEQVKNTSVNTSVNSGAPVGARVGKVIRLRTRSGPPKKQDAVHHVMAVMPRAMASNGADWLKGRARQVIVERQIKRVCDEFEIDYAKIISLAERYAVTPSLWYPPARRHASEVFLDSKNIREMLMAEREVEQVAARTEQANQAADEFDYDAAARLFGGGNK